MYDSEMRKDCQMRGNLGNCSPVGGFCMDAVSDEICDALHNAYDHGFYNAVRTLKEHEAVPVVQREVMHLLVWCCGSCGTPITYGDKFCRMCGHAISWEEMTDE